MIYVLLGVAIFIALIWAGRRARPILVKREMRILSAVIGGAAMAGGALAAVRGAYLPGAVAAALGAGLVFGGRLGYAGPGAKPAKPAEMAELVEARDILGVGPGATREEIQAAYARLIRAVHPDAGGSSGLAARLNAARDVLLKS
jgi:hypothetical protein